MVQRRLSAEALIHSVNIVKSLVKSERSDIKTKRYAKAQVERLGSAEPVEIRAFIPETSVMQLRKLSQH